MTAGPTSSGRWWSLLARPSPAGWRPFALPRSTNLAFRQACTPGYYNGEGRAGEGQGLFDGLYGPGSDAFFTLMKAWREAGDMHGLQVH